MLSDAFMLELEGMKHKNLAVEALKKLLNGEIISRTRTNLVCKGEISLRPEQAIARYYNRRIDAIQIFQELINIIKDLRAELVEGFMPEERALYDARAQNGSAADIISNESLRVIATEFVQTVRSNSGTDWWCSENVRAKMRVAVKKFF